MALFQTQHAKGDGRKRKIFHSKFNQPSKSYKKPNKTEYFETSFQDHSKHARQNGYKVTKNFNPSITSTKNHR